VTVFCDWGLAYEPLDKLQLGLGVISAAVDAG
jgi:hypothetical protein